MEEDLNAVYIEISKLNFPDPCYAGNLLTKARIGATTQLDYALAA